MTQKTLTRLKKTAYVLRISKEQEIQMNPQSAPIQISTMDQKVNSLPALNAIDTYSNCDRNLQLLISTIQEVFDFSTQD